MKINNNINETWIKASIIGTIWAASEIVLGSFLHNLKIPFSGNVLTAIAIIILISISYTWKEKGLFWRAGLICAVMKTMSPSAVIFGPMVAIFSEALLLEISVRVFSKTLIGFALGAMLAMSWNLFHKIFNYIIFYGFNIVELYKNLTVFAQKQLDLQLDIVWLPIIVLLIIYCLFGLFSAIIGIKVGRKIVKQPLRYSQIKKVNNYKENINNSKSEFNYSLIWLFINIFFIIISLILLNFTTWIFWSLSISAVAFVWAMRYKRAMRQLLRPKFWIFFVVITMITAFVFTKMESNNNGFNQGLLIGIQMNFRALLIILGFSVLGTELYNPKIREFFLKTSFRQLPLALELSFESLPSMIANIPEFKILIKNPVSIVYQIISQAEFRLNEIKNTRKVFIITGSVGQGKTTYLQKIIEILKENNILISGIYSPRIMENNDTIGYDIIDIESNKSEILLRKNSNNNYEKIGKYYIYPQGFSHGNEILKLSKNIDNKIVVIDEVGFLELENKGWANNISELIKETNKHLLITVRENLVENVINKWEFKNYFIFNISENSAVTISDSIISKFQ